MQNFVHTLVLNTLTLTAIDILSKSLSKLIIIFHIRKEIDLDHHTIKMSK